MENNSNQLSLLSGVNAYNLNASFQNLFDKSLDNKKQYNQYDANTFSETNESLLKTLDVIDFNIRNEHDNTYTLEDLLDLGNEDFQQPDTQFFESLEDEPLFSSNDLLVQTALPSPVSSSSDESCDLDDLLFMEESTDTLPQSESPVFTTDPQLVSNVTEVQPVDTTQPQDIMNGTDLSALVSLIFQNHGIAAPSSSFEEPGFSPAPSSPTSSTSSDSESEKTSLEDSSPRYKPYSKKKQKTPEQKLRKKAQNRTAACRYRTKKKDELKIMTEEADKLEEKNTDLKGKVEGLRNEIDYLKNLMLDVIKARLTKGATPESLLLAAATNL